MQVKLSKKNWEAMGKKAGWIKIAQEDKPVCKRCKGKGSIYEKVRNLSNLGTYDSVSETCPSCDGKGYITEEDRARYRHNEGIGPCPWGNDCGCEKDKADKATKADDLVSRRRHIRVTMDDGQVFPTEINGTVPEIEKYYLTSEPTDYDETGKTHRPVKVEFLG